MVASPPDKWMWNIDEDFKFRVRDIRSFAIREIIMNIEPKESYCLISVYLVNNETCAIPINKGHNKEWCQDWIDNFIKENLWQIKIDYQIMK